MTENNDQKAKATADCAPMTCSVESVNRQVIENKLLTALDDKSKVAILATEDDLRMLINALKTHSMCYPGWSKKNSEYVADLEQLKAAAFPPNAKSCDGGLAASDLK